MTPIILNDSLLAHFRKGRGRNHSFVPSLPFMYLKKSLQHYFTLIKVKLYKSLREKIDRHRDLIYPDYRRKIGDEIRKLETIN